LESGIVQSMSIQIKKVIDQKISKAYLCSLEHIIDDVTHVRNESVHANFQQHDDGSADIFSHFRVVVIGQEEEVLDEIVYMLHEGLSNEK